MNIFEQEDLIKGLPDQALMKEAQQPSGQLPQYLVVSEIQRRQDMRKRFSAENQETPQDTIKDQILSGIAAMGDQQPQQQQPPQPGGMPPQPGGMPPQPGGMPPGAMPPQPGGMPPMGMPPQMPPPQQPMPQGAPPMGMSNGGGTNGRSETSYPEQLLAFNTQVQPIRDRLSTLPVNPRSGLRNYEDVEPLYDQIADARGQYPSLDPNVPASARAAELLERFGSQELQPAFDKLTNKGFVGGRLAEMLELEYDRPDPQPYDSEVSDATVAELNARMDAAIDSMDRNELINANVPDDLMRQYDAVKAVDRDSGSKMREALVERYRPKGDELAMNVVSMSNGGVTSPEQAAELERQYRALSAQYPGTDLSRVAEELDSYYKSARPPPLNFTPGAMRKRMALYDASQNGAVEAERRKAEVAESIALGNQLNTEFAVQSSVPDVGALPYYPSTNQDAPLALAPSPATSAAEVLGRGDVGGNIYAGTDTYGGFMDPGAASIGRESGTGTTPGSGFGGTSNALLEDANKLNDRSLDEATIKAGSNTTGPGEQTVRDLAKRNPPPDHLNMFGDTAPGGSPANKPPPRGGSPAPGVGSTGTNGKVSEGITFQSLAQRVADLSTDVSKPDYSRAMDTLDQLKKFGSSSVFDKADFGSVIGQIDRPEGLTDFTEFKSDYSKLITEAENRARKIKEDARKDAGSQALIQLGAGIAEGDIAGALRGAGTTASEIMSQARKEASAEDQLSRQMQIAQMESNRDIGIMGKQAGIAEYNRNVDVALQNYAADRTAELSRIGLEADVIKTTVGLETDIADATYDANVDARKAKLNNIVQQAVILRYESLGKTAQLNYDKSQLDLIKPAIQRALEDWMYENQEASPEEIRERMEMLTGTFMPGGGSAALTQGGTLAPAPGINSRDPVGILGSD